MSNELFIKGKCEIGDQGLLPSLPSAASQSNANLSVCSDLAKALRFSTTANRMVGFDFMRDEENDHSTPLERWIIGSRSGDEDSLNRLAEYLLPKAFEIANRRMMRLSPVDDYEDIALSAVKSICLRFRDGSRGFLGEQELGGLLRSFVIGKIRDRKKYHAAGKRNIAFDSDHDPSNSIAEPVATTSNDVAWLDEQSIHLPFAEQRYLESMLRSLGAEVGGLFSGLVKRLDEKPRRVLMLITTGTSSNHELAQLLDCAPASIERYRQAIRRKLEEIVNE
ncbi:hypothetical protein [Rhodopirellula bahusiensis]|uniref:hypothetical protein n=1 Tax=Rhodopirellula bahusiensis TaxID=2014065 RepID=UPI003264B3B5